MAHGVFRPRWQVKPGCVGKHENATPYSRRTKHKNAGYQEEYQ